MIGRLRDRIRNASGGVSFAVDVLNRTGFLGALSPSGVLEFARSVRGVKPGPHLAVMLHAANKPEKVALIEGTRRYTYGEFNRQINQLANGLSTLGVKGGDRVAIMMPNCAEYLIVGQALARVGATAVQIGYRLKGPEIAYILENSEPAAVIAHYDYLPQMKEGLADARRSTARIPDDTHIIVTRAEKGALLRGTRFEDLLASNDGSRPPASSGGGGVIVYTSGTTGKPKGANRDLSKTGLESVADFLSTMGMSHDDVHLVVCPLYHSAAPAFAYMVFTLGGTVVVMDHFDAERALGIIAQQRVTCAFMVPTMLVRLNQLDEKVRRKYDTSSLRWVCSGAAPLATETAREFQEKFGQLLWNFYGSTETGIVTLAGPDDHTSHPGTVGRLVRGNEVRLLGDDGQPVRTGEVGELFARNSMLITGYHKNREATEKSLSEGFFSVGDLARVDADGYYYLESRKHDMVISGGVNIYPREIEDHLHTHPDIIEAAVIGVPDEEWGESLKAFIVLREGARLAEQDVAAFCKDALADFKRPRKIEFMDALPRNPTGKVLKRELRAR